jgi:transposase
MSIVDVGRRRRWSAEAKLRIVEESFAGWRQASATARRHGISSSLLFAWRKAYHAGTLVDAGPGSFVPQWCSRSIPRLRLRHAGSRFSTPSGYRVWVDADVDEAALLRVLAALARA